MVSLNIPDVVRDLIYKKRAIIVGPAAYLTGKGRGKIIDEYDVVIRPNYFHLPTHMHSDYGSRTDIMCHNMASVYLSGLQEQVKENREVFESLKLLIGSGIKSGPKDSGWLGWSDDHVSECSTNFSKLGVESVPYWWIGVSNYKQTYNEIYRCEPFTGISSIIITTSCQPSELHLTGFDFYSGSKLYAEGYLASMDQGQEHRNPSDPHGPGSTEKNRQYVKRWHDNYEFTSVDLHMKELLG